MSGEITPAFSEVIHSPTRLRICALLRPVAELEFSVVKDLVGLTDATLSKNLRVLADAGYIQTRKGQSLGRQDRRRLTWIGLTEVGREAVEGHIAALEEMFQSDPKSQAAS
ncbi:transcriptional regulator [Actinomyces sp. MRS3W]|uniref:transcriptional regulator n=1 Tax=Actinomyces sp. MRS3W TaxID=2800796 RepID=UPI0028FD5B13|nr:transcriptional regulator [Actinomyces sp. MRS3W]MDU0348340.1 transcriptional regulator [Actinomyces sp. MRS3W]